MPENATVVVQLPYECVIMAFFICFTCQRLLLKALFYKVWWPILFWAYQYQYQYLGKRLNNTNTNTWGSVLTIPIPIQLKNPIPIPLTILLVNSGRTSYEFPPSDCDLRETYRDMVKDVSSKEQSAAHSPIWGDRHRQPLLLLRKQLRRSSLRQLRELRRQQGRQQGRVPRVLPPIPSPTGWWEISIFANIDILVAFPFSTPKPLQY